MSEKTEKYGWEDERHDWEFLGHAGIQATPAHRHLMVTCDVYRCRKCHEVKLEWYKRSGEPYRTKMCEG